MDYEILIRGKAGQYSGGHRIATPGALPEPITNAQWPDVCASINTAALAELERVTAELDATKAALEAYKAQGLQAAKAVVSVVDNQSIDDKETALACKQIALQVLTPEIEHERQALLAQQAEIAAKLEAISGL